MKTPSKISIPHEVQKIFEKEAKAYSVRPLGQEAFYLGMCAEYCRIQDSKKTRHRIKLMDQAEATVREGVSLNNSVRVLERWVESLKVENEQLAAKYEELLQKYNESL